MKITSVRPLIAALRTSVLPRLLALAAVCLGVSASNLRATIPSGALTDSRYPLGYLVVTYYAGVKTDGTGDSTAGIQQAIDDAKANYLTVFFPAGTYIITDTLRLYHWQLWDTGTGAPGNPDQKSVALVGSKSGGRPVIKLAAGATGFTSAGTPRPMVSFRNFAALNASGNSEVNPSNGLQNPPNFEDKPVNLFAHNLRNLDFDCNGNAGAVGVVFNSAQFCSMQNVRVVATNAFAGIVGVPGVGGAANLEVEGGQYGLVMGAIPGGPTFPVAQEDLPTIAGLRLFNQTTASIVSNAYSGSVQAVGFHIKPASTGQVVQISSSNPTIRGTVLMIDGVIDMTNKPTGIAIDNTPGKTINLRNVYVTGTDSLIKSGAISTTGSGTWKQIKDYTFTDQTAAPHAGNYQVGDTVVETFSVINGTKSRTPSEPVKSIFSNVAAPVVTDLINRHIWTNLPSFEDGAYENPLTYGATAETSNAAMQSPAQVRTGPDDTAAFQAAIDAAAAVGSPAQGRVVVPRGAFHISAPLILKANTQLIGASPVSSQIGVHDSWQPTTGSPFMLQTVDDIAATTFLGWVGVQIRRVGGGQVGGVYVYDRFSHVQWRAGQLSMSMGWIADQEYANNLASNDRTLFTFTGNGGGRHYGFASPGRGTGGAGYRSLVIDGTHEPLWIYTCNVEATKSGGGVDCATNIYINNASKIRLLGIKREGRSPSVKINGTAGLGSHNIGIFGHEDRQGVNVPLGADVQVTGTCDGILLACAGQRNVSNLPAGRLLLQENITGFTAFNIPWPEGISVYKRGELNDDDLVIGGSLPSPWVTADVGTTGATGSASYSGGTFTVLGSGADIFGGTDAFRYVFQTWTGNATLIARVATEQNTSNWAKAGIMIRKNLNNNCTHATLSINPAAGGNGIEFLRRTADGSATTDNTFVAGLPPRWLKLVRVGDNFTAYHSTNGTSWTQLGGIINIPMNGLGSVDVGLVVCAHAAGTLNTSTFDSVSVTGNSVPDITTTSLPGMIAGESYNQTLSATGGDGALVWSLDSGALPTGLSLSTGGVITGSSSSTGTFNFTVRVADSDGVTGPTDEDTQALSIVVSANSVPNITTTTLPDGLVGAAYNQTLAATGGNGALVWSVSAGSLPAGLNLATNGVISGTPTTGGIASFTVKAADSDGVTGPTDEDTQALTLSITVGPFTSQDVGSPALGGSASLSGGVYTVTGGGTDIWGTADQFRFLHESWTGDGRVIAHVLSVQNTHANAKGGVMFREDTTAGSKNVDFVVNATYGIQLTHRDTTGGTSVSDALSAGFTAPYWLRLERHGNLFTGWQSPDGLSWFLTGATPATGFTMNSTLRVGLIANSHNAAQLSTSTFDNVSIANVPAWTAQDIGSVGAAGSTTPDYSTDIITLNAAGANIFGTTDSFHFYYLAWTAGDATIIAEVTSVENTSTFAKGGLMIRKSLAANSAHATVNVTPGNGVEFLRRTTDGGTTTNTNTTGLTAPRFIKLVRSSATNSFTAFQSPDGGTWTQVGTADTVSMSGTVYVGLVGCSIINTTNLCTSTFESVFVK